MLVPRAKATLAKFFDGNLTSSSMVLDTSKALVPPAPALRVDEGALTAYMQRNVPGFDATEGCQVSQFNHGQSNPTYFVKAGGKAYVLRKKPPPPTLPSAHAVEREYQVLRALGPTPVPVPRALCLCEDPAVLGTPFYVMEHVAGRIFDDPSLPGLDPGQRTAVYRAQASTLAALHSVRPGQVGLQGYGADRGYNARQVRRWGQQYLKSVAPGEEPMGEMVALMEQLAARVPASDADPSATRISHGDYRLDNLVFDGARCDRVAAVLDWELSTLGDPLADLAYNCLPYHLPKEIPSLVQLPCPLPAGIPSEEQYIEMYCHARGLPYPLPADWPFYLALSIFRLASILAGVGARAKQGNASSANAAQMGADWVVRALAATALRILSGGGGKQLTPHDALVGTPQEPYANPTHPSAHPDPKLIVEGTPLEQYANPSPQWRQAAESSSRALEEAERALPPSTPAESGASRPGDGLRRSATAAQPSLHASSAAVQAQVGLGPSERVLPLVAALHAFMEVKVYPAEPVLNAHAVSDDRWSIHPVQEQLKEEARALGLWNLWIPDDMAAALQPLVAEAEGGEDGAAALLGPGLTNLEYAHCAEVMGRSVWAPECFNCSAPDTGNMEVLARYGSDAQRRRWLLPLLRGDVRSCFAMTEPAVASSDATNVEASIAADGRGGYVLNGRKWWISGACDPRCAVAIFMGKTDPTAAVHRQQSMVLVPMDSPGVTVVRPLPVFGFEDAPHGHAEVVLQDVGVPGEAMILGEGRGFEIAQGRLGPGRLHHCMRLIGMGERAIALMAQRGAERVAFGRPLAAHQSVRLDLARSRVELDAARLTVLEAARALDVGGAKAARGQIAAAKALAPSAVLAILDRAIQVHGGAGVSNDTPLAAMWAGARTLRLADGPDVVHFETIAKLELARQVGRRARL